MGLFDKKYCDFCGEKIGILGIRKLEDGSHPDADHKADHHLKACLWKGRADTHKNA